MQKITIIVNSCLRNILLWDNLYKQKGERNRFNTISKAENVTRVRRTFNSFLHTQTTINTRLQKITILDHYRLRNTLLMEPTMNTCLKMIKIFDHSRLRNILFRDNLYKQKG